MPLIYADRVKETTTTTGTGTLTLAGAASGHQSFAAVGNANTCVYGLEASDGAWEVGIGTYTLSGTTLARTTILASSNAGAAITLPAGTHSVYVTVDATRFGALMGHRGALMVRNDGTTTQSLAITTFAKVTVINDEEYDPESWWDNTNKRFQPDEPGHYLINCGLQVTMGGHGDRSLLLVLRRSTDGNAPTGDFIHLARGWLGTSGNAGVSGSAVIYLDGDNDFVEVWAWQNGSEASPTVAGAERCWLSAVKASNA